MNKRESGTILLAIVALTVIILFKDLLNQNFSRVGLALIAATIVIATNIGAKKLTARTYGASVEHSFWLWERFGLKPTQHLEKPIPLGAILSFAITILTKGWVKCAILLSYDTNALPGGKRKIAGYTYTEMTDWHTSLIGAAGIATTLLVSFICYWIPQAHLIAQAAAFYAFFNLVPFSKLDGAQIFFGSRVLWTALALVSALFAFVALIVI